MGLKIDSLVHRLSSLPPEEQGTSLAASVASGDVSRGAAAAAARRIGLGTNDLDRVLTGPTASASPDGLDPSGGRGERAPVGTHAYGSGYGSGPATHHRPIGRDTVLGVRLDSTGGVSAADDPQTASAKALALHWARHEKAAPFKGTAAVMGGAIHSDSIFAALRAAAKKDADAAEIPKIAVLVSSKPDFAAAKKVFYEDDVEDGKVVDDSIEHWFQKQGLDPVFVPITIDHRGPAADLDLADEIRACSAVYLCGGAQWRHTRCLLEADGTDTPALAAIREILDRGGVVSGSSAGGHTQGAIQYGVGDAYDYLVHNDLDAEDMKSIDPSRQAGDDPGPLQMGMGLIGRLGAVTCTHFDRRHRLGRLLVALKETDELRGVSGGTDHKRAIGIGVDEDTGLFIEGSVGRAHGENGIFLVDASQAEYGDGEHFSVSGLRLTYLSEGDAYDFDERKVLTEKAAPDDLATKGYDTDDLMRRYEMTRMIRGLVRSEATQAIGRTEQGEPRFTFVLSKDDQTRCFIDGDHKVAAEGLILDVAFDD